MKTEIKKMLQWGWGRMWQWQQNLLEDEKKEATVVREKKGSGNSNGA